jgi:hypothetical protein
MCDMAVHAEGSRAIAVQKQCQVLPALDADAHTHTRTHTHTHTYISNISNLVHEEESRAIAVEKQCKVLQELDTQLADRIQEDEEWLQSRLEGAHSQTSTSY